MSPPGESGREQAAMAARWLRWLLSLGLLLGSCLNAAAAQPTAIGAVTPTATAPRWTEADIRASRVEAAGAAAWPHRPRWNADPMNLFVVVEAGDAHLSLVDGDRFEVVHRLRSRPALQGPPRFSPDGRFAYFGSRDGWITRYDLWNLALVAEVRAGLELGSLAISQDGRWLMAANPSPPTLVLFDAGLNLVKTWVAGNRDGTTGSRIAAVIDAAPRQSFIVALQDIPELWEISYDPKVEDFYDGLVHDYRMAEGLPTRGFLNPRRTTIAEPLESLFFDPETTQVAGVAQAKDGSAVLQLVNLDVRRRVASLPLAGAPRLGGAAAFRRNDAMLLAVPNRERATVDVIDLRTWSAVKSVATAGPTSFVRSHAGTRFAWSNAMTDRDGHGALALIDRQTLETVTGVADGAEGVVDIALSRDGRHAWVSRNGPAAALIVYDAATLKQVKRLSMRQPAAAYNVGNQIARPSAESGR